VEVAGRCRRLHNGEHYKWYTTPNIIRVIKSRKMRWAGLVAHMGEMRNTYEILVGKPEEKTREHIRMDLRETGWEGVNEFMWLGIRTSNALL
jgi:hypothetical protein